METAKAQGCCLVDVRIRVRDQPWWFVTPHTTVQSRAQARLEKQKDGVRKGIWCKNQCLVGCGSDPLMIAVEGNLILKWWMFSPGTVGSWLFHALLLTRALIDVVYNTVTQFAHQLPAKTTC